MKIMTLRQLEIAREIEENFGDAEKYETFCKHQDQRITEFYTNGSVDAQDGYGNTLLHYMCVARKLPKKFSDDIVSAFYKAFEYDPDPTITNYCTSLSPSGYVLHPHWEWEIERRNDYCKKDYCGVTIKSCLKEYEKSYEKNRLNRVEKELRNTQYALLHLLQGLHALTNGEGPEPTKVANNHWHNAINLLKSRER